MMSSMCPVQLTVMAGEKPSQHLRNIGSEEEEQAWLATPTSSFRATLVSRAEALGASVGLYNPQ